MALIYPLGLTSTDFSDGYTGPGYNPQSYVYGSHIVIPSSGTVTQLGVKEFPNSGNGFTNKIGLYTSGGVLLAQSTYGSGADADGLVWRNSGAISISVTAGTYYVLCSAPFYYAAQYGYDTSGDGSYATEAYATAMPATETINAEAEVGTLFGVRLDFTADGGSSIAPGSRISLLGVG